MAEFSISTEYRAEIMKEINVWREKGCRIGFTNGCFDLLHPGHISLLNNARLFCDRLIVGLNSDMSVQKLKGSTRPVQSEESRGIVLMALRAVDSVIVFNEETPIKLVEEVKPDVLFKGGDYSWQNVVGANFVEAYGGEVKIIPLVVGFSSTKLIEKLRSSE